jgi:hypothetical protein
MRLKDKDSEDLYHPDLIYSTLKLNGNHALGHICERQQVPGNRESTALNYFLAFCLIGTVIYEPIR